MSELYQNFRYSKQVGDKEREMHALLQKPGLEQRINAIAATLADTFSASTKLLHDLIPGDEFIDESTKLIYIYDNTVVPFDVGSLNEMIFSLAKQPYEELKDQGYFNFRQKDLQGSRYVMSLKDFIKCLAIGRFRMLNPGTKSGIDVSRVLNL